MSYHPDTPTEARTTSAANDHLPAARSAPVRTSHLQQWKAEGKRWAMLTAYDYTSATAFAEAGIPVLLVGDSAANVVYGEATTVPVTVDELLPLARGVVRGAPHCLVVADLPFGSYEDSPSQALAAATRFFKEAGVQAVKVEGGKDRCAAISHLTAAGIPVMAHLGFTPQSVNTLGGFKVQGRAQDAATRLLADAEAVAQAGAFAVVLEMVPAALAAEVTQRVAIPTIGIGAGVDCDAQVLVWQDMAGMTPGRIPKFVRRFAQIGTDLRQAAAAYAAAVHCGEFPAAEHSF